MKKALITLLKGVLAGASIGLGGFLYILFHYLIKGEGGLILGSLFFTIGLFLVCTLHLNLFTGKVGQVFEKKQEKDFYISLLIMYIGNIIGAIGLGYICFAIFKNTDLFEVAYEVAKSKLKFSSFFDTLSGMIKSTLCGFCVYAAVKCYSLRFLKPKGVFFLVFFIFGFVYTSCKHCIANMFYFAISNMYGDNYLSFIDIPVCTIFNTLGSLIGALQYKLYTEKNNEIISAIN